MNKGSIWAPSWPWVIGFAALVAGLFYWAVSDGLDPFQMVGAALFGGLGGAVGAAAKHLLEKSAGKDSWFASLLPAAGFIAGTGLSKGMTVFLQKSVAPELASQLILGLVAGAVVGLIPKGLISEKGENFRNWSFWASGAAGLVGGLILALPLAIILTVIGRRRYPASTAAPVTPSVPRSRTQVTSRPSPTSSGAAKPMLLTAMAVWALAWILPSYDSGEPLYGWGCFRVTVLGFTSLFGEDADPSLYDFLRILSPWTNLLVPAAVFFLHYWRPSWLRDNLGACFYWAWILNLVWIADGTYRGDLMVGYYLWWLSFLAMGITVSKLVREGKDEKNLLFSALARDDPHTVKVVGGLVAVVMLVGFALASPRGPSSVDDSDQGSQTAAANTQSETETTTKPPSSWNTPGLNNLPRMKSSPFGTNTLPGTLPGTGTNSRWTFPRIGTTPPATVPPPRWPSTTAPPAFRYDPDKFRYDPNKWKGNSTQGTSQPSGLTGSESGRRIHLTNNCQQSIRVAVKYTKVDGSWAVAGWWKFGPGSSRHLTFQDGKLARTNSGVLFYYAETEDGSLYWGDEKNVVTFDGRQLPMRRLEDNVGDTEWTLGCDE